MKPLPALLLPLLLAIAGCDEPAPAPDAAAAASQPNEYHERLKAMKEPLRDATFMRAILDSKHSCKRVIKSEYRGRYQNLEMWTAQCDKAGKWAVFLGADASVQVRTCGDLVQLGLPACEGPMPKE